MVKRMPCYYNEQPPLLNTRRTKDVGEEDKYEDGVGKVTTLIFNKLLVYLKDYGLAVIECCYYSGCPYLMLISSPKLNSSLLLYFTFAFFRFYQFSSNRIE